MSNSNVGRTGQLSFSVDSGLLFELGEQLVAKPSIALAELIKNSYDADATRVKVRFANVGVPGGTITIADDGHGMTFEEIEHGWMRIASSSKKAFMSSRRYKRPLTGAKGIGRFATRRLGAVLNLRSVVQLPNNRREAIFVSFDWSAFVSGAEISDIPVRYKRIPVSSECPTGVTLKILRAHDSWKNEDIENLKKDIVGLVSPFPIRPSLDNQDRDPGFNIVLEVDGEEFDPTVGSNLSQDFLEAAWGKLSAQIDEHGVATYRLQFLRANYSDTEIRDDTEIYPNLINTNLTLYFHQYEQKEAYAGLSFSVVDARRLGREYGGVRIFLDNFRIYPYGEPSDDWLRLADTRSRNVDMANIIPMSEVIRSFGEAAERPYLDIPGNNQLFGYVTLSQSIHADANRPIGERLNVKASREGFVENQVFEQLRRFVQRGVYWLTMQYSSVRQGLQKQGVTPPKTTDKIAETRRDLEDLPSRIAEVVAEVASEPRQPSLLRDEVQLRLERERTVQKITEAVTPVVNPIRQNLEMVERGHIAEQEELISVIAMLRLLASAGASLLVMEHQFNPVLRAVSGIKADAKRLREQIPDLVVVRYDRLILQIEEWEQLVTAIVSPLVSLLNPAYRERRRRWVTFEIVEEIRRALQHYMNEHHIDFENTVPATLRTPPIYRAELYSILLNLLTNALKAVHGYPDRRIRIEAYRTQDDGFVLRMSNTGKKAPQDKWEEYFRPFVTDSIPDSGLGVGTGLGLSVVRDTVSEYSGTARFVQAHSPWQTCVQITLPSRGNE